MKNYLYLPYKKLNINQKINLKHSLKIENKSIKEVFFRKKVKYKVKTRSINNFDRYNKKIIRKSVLTDPSKYEFRHFMKGYWKELANFYKK